MDEEVETVREHATMLRYTHCAYLVLQLITIIQSLEAT